MPGSAGGYLFFIGLLRRQAPERDQLGFELLVGSMLVGREHRQRQQLGERLDRPLRGKEPSVGEQPVARRDLRRAGAFPRGHGAGANASSC